MSYSLESFAGALRRVVAALACGALVGVGAGCTQSADEAGSPATVEQGVADLLASLHNLEPTPLDMSDEVQRAFFLEQQRLAGSTLENNSDLAEFVGMASEYHARLGVPNAGRVMLTMTGERLDVETGEATDNSVGPIQTISSFQQDESNPLTYTASALASVPGQPSTCTHTLVVADQNGNPQGNGVSLTQQLACESIHLAATGTLDAGDEWAKAVLTYYWIDGGTPYSGVLAAEGSTIPTQIVSTDPRDINGDGMIKFCFGRVSADCDYEPSGGSASNVYLPIVGYTTYDTVIEDPATDPDASVYIAMSQPEPESGGGCTLQGNVADFMSNYVTLSNGNMQVNWNDPTVSFPAINSTCMPNGSIVYYTMSMNIDLNSGGNRLPVFFGISSSPDTPVSTGFWLQLPSTRVYYSCVAEGTQIALMDGQAAPIEGLQADDRILSNRDGQAMTVYATYQGDEDFMIRLVTDSGRELLITDTHPVVLVDDIVLAGDIAAGDQVRTIDGPEHVVSAERVAYHGVVRNLSVGTEADGVPITSHNTTFFANGFLVGDNEMQWAFATERRRLLLSASGPVPIETLRSGIAN